ncbi:glycoside hydrolase family 127 protein [Fontisphaera persica]|uniref:glycoside hydrolase family 127 protein n=1 Tax=Fontisphaera persica TaxID=2974023 RepID=UPI0024C0D2F8|nr:glycoside hydrolase family 127 protein [Fontisphaera persica]WCJ60344.1 glycoside hydrolase family 127 protein [Fontisphaera persica]
MRYLKLCLAAYGASVLALAAAQSQDYPYQPVPFTAVTVNDAFWSPRFETNRQTTVWYDFQKCEETGRIDNFAKAGGLMPGPFRGIPFDDSDVYKVIEGAAYILAMHPDPRLDKYLDDLIAKITAAQEPDGYLYTARRLLPPDKMPAMSGPTRWSHLKDSHELYNVGHLYEAAVAHFQATGKRSLLNIALKNADFLCETFGPGKVQYPPGHQEIEIGLVKLYRVTGQKKYLNLARYLLDIRGRPETHPLYGLYYQDHLPVTEQKEAVGHAVRAGYMYSGMADVAAILGERAYIDAIGRIWEDVVTGKLHLTGGIGARPEGEAFGDKYELPNKTAYLETCAAIANALWNHRMFLLHGDAKYMDVLERVIYNGFLSGVAFSGDRFFYPNPLEADGHTKFNHGSNQRQAWFGCSCCPVNVVRFIPSIAGYIYATRGDHAYVNLFIGGSGEMEVAGQKVRLEQTTRYPWEGSVRITVKPQRATRFALHVRIPGWARQQPVPSDLYRYLEGGADAGAPRLTVNRRSQPLQMDKGFAVIDRTWRSGDVVELTLPMPPRRVLSHPAVKANERRVAIERGPIVYCAEAVDNGGRALNLVLDDQAPLRTEWRPGLLHGVTVVKARGQAVTRTSDGRVVTQPTEINLVPYYAWNHRGVGEMAVWLPRTPDRAQVPPPPTLAGQSKVSASHVWHLDTAKAAHDGLEPKNSGDHDIPRLTFWDHRGSQEWVQYDFPQTTTVAATEVYWFDDTGRGSCRVPASWRILYRDGQQWKPVNVQGEYSVKKDTYNRVSFAPVATGALRLEVQLQPGYSAGLLEWKVFPQP